MRRWVCLWIMGWSCWYSPSGTAAPPWPILPAQALPKPLPNNVFRLLGRDYLLSQTDKLSYTGLAPAKLFPDLCVYRYRVSTQSVPCQQLVDQGLGYYYSYVWMESARSFETALRHDPECAFAWYGLSKAIEKWGKGNAIKPLERAQELMPLASLQEQALIKARLQEKGLWPNVNPDERKKRAAQTLDDLLTLHEDDEEAWFARAQLAEGNAAVPYYKALLRLNPLHPGANHELVHFYENWKRPALGWPYAEKYIESSPGIPHAFHMQAHLATRLGKWQKTSDYSARAIVLQRAYHREQNVNPADDHQYVHHLDILTRSLIHDGRFAEARQIRVECESDKVSLWEPWFRLYLAEGDYAEALKVVEHFRKKDKHQAAYFAALVYLEQNELLRAAAEIETLRYESQRSRANKRLELRLWETQGRLLCKQGSVDAGLKLLQRAVDRLKDDYSHHAWGNGAYYMEIWGLAALEGGRADVAEEAFLESLAHDPGSVRAALGMAALCERLGRSGEAERFAALARKCWSRADSHHFDRLREHIQKLALAIVPKGKTPITSAGSGN